MCCCPPAAGYVNGAVIPVDGGANSLDAGMLEWDVSTVAGIDVSPEHFIDGERVGSDDVRGDSPIDWSKLADVAAAGAREADAGGGRGVRGVPGVGRAGRRPAAPGTCAGWPT